MTIENKVMEQNSLTSSTKGRDLSLNTKTHRNEEKAQIAASLSMAANVLKLYGKTAVNLERLVEGLSYYLGDYSGEVIAEAITQHVRRNTTLPTPAEIIAIIDPPKKTMDKAVYISLKKKDVETLTDDEYNYIQAYEAEQTGRDYGSDTMKVIRLQEDNDRLKLKVRDLENENRKLDDLLREARKDWKPPRRSINQKIEDTVNEMKKQGRTPQEIDEFKQSMGLAV